MTNRTKIIIGIIIVIIIIAIFVGIKSKTTETNVNENREIDEYGNVFDYLNEMTEGTNNTVENTTVIENSISTETNENTVNNTQSINNTVIGQEEQESSNENTQVNNEATAIELAQKEWGLSIDAYDFEATLQTDGTYIVVVRNDTTRNEITRYTVNIQTGAVTEAE